MHDRTFTREFALDRARLNPEKREVELSFSSELAVERYFGQEVLSHDPGAVDLSRLNTGSGPLLFNHDVDQLIGRVTRAWIGSDRKARASVRFGNSARAKELWADVQDGIIETVSVGYKITEMKEEKKNGQSVFRATRWQPLEISLVSVPADSSVGINRSVQQENQNRMTVNEPNDSAGEIQAISQILEKQGVTGIRQLASRSILENRSVEDFRREAFKLLPNVQPVRQAEPLDVKPKDWARYSITRALRMQMPGEKRDGLEEEMNQEMTRRTGQRGEGILVPPEVLTRNWIAGTGTLGGMLIETQNAGDQFVSLLRNRAMVTRLGARVLTLNGPTTIPRQNAAGTANWVGETVAATLSTGNFTQLTLTPQGLSAFQQFSKALLFQADPSCDELVRGDILAILALAIDAAALHGTGSGQPTGITNQTGITTLNLGVNGGSFSVANAHKAMVSLESALANSNADMGSLAYLTNAKMRARLKVLDENTTTASARWVWRTTESGQEVVNGYRSAVSNQVSSIQTLGTATTICSSVFFGNWNDILIANFNGGAVDLVVDPYTLAVNGVVRVIARQWTDVAVRHPESFSILLGVLDS